MIEHCLTSSADSTCMATGDAGNHRLTNRFYAWERTSPVLGEAFIRGQGRQVFAISLACWW
jgi:hypothetical protein